MGENNKIKENIKKIFVIIIIVLLLYLSYKSFIFYLPFLIAYIISLMIEPIIRKLTDKTNLNRKVSSIIVMFLVFSILIALIAWGITGLISEASNLLDKLNFYLDRIITYIEWIIGNLDFNKFNLSDNIKNIVEDSSKEIIQNLTNILKQILSRVLETVYSIPKMAIYLVITILATYFITSDKFYILDRIEHHVPRKIVDKINIKTEEIKKTLGNYLKAQGILFLIAFFVYLIGLYIFKIIGMDVRYPLLMAIIILILDVLPILGAGTIVIPWIIILFINNNKGLAFSLLGLYILNIAIREFLEPKIVSKKIGIHPIFTLIAMYTGFKFIGILGMIIGPIVLIILKNIFSQTIEDGIIKTILKDI
ncbi:MAG: sporulation integral membrane protein YtvI [Candidatus Scatovivens sp.]